MILQSIDSRVRLITIKALMTYWIVRQNMSFKMAFGDERLLALFSFCALKPLDVQVIFPSYVSL